MHIQVQERLLYSSLVINELIKYIAKAIRAISIPPIVVSIFVGILLLTKTVSNIEGLFLFIFLGLIQLSAYPLSYLIKPIRLKGREGMRNLAFIVGLIGYSLGLIYALATNASHSLKVIYITYFISIVVLFFINKVLKVRASGHMTSITGPLVGLVYFIGFHALIPCIIFYILVFWSSYYLKRHTVKEMILGTLIVITSFGLTHLILLV